MVICVLEDLSVIMCLPPTSLGSVTSGVNPAATLVRTSKHFYRRRRSYHPSGEAKECQQAFLALLPGRK
jgi:hypothetical protein